MSVNEFAIGIESEGYWKGKHSKLSGEYPGAKQFAQALVPIYNGIRPNMLRADFSKESHPGDSKDPPDPRWIVTLDSAIGKNDLGYVAPVGYHPLEFVSPTEKLTFGPKSQWRMNVKKHWETLLQIVEVEINDGCATHVHVSPRKEERWTLEQLKPIAKAVIYFNDAFKEIYAPSRRNHDFTYSNKDDNYKLKDQDFAECCKLIDNCASKHAIINLMQAGKTKADHQSRYYAWNFENTEKGKKGSIEFRCAPGATKVEHCLIWVELGLSFVHAATKSDTSQVLEKRIFEGNADGLKEFILRAARDDMNDKKSLDIVFHKNKDREGWSDDEMWAAFDKLL